MPLPVGGAVLPPAVFGGPPKPKPTGLPMLPASDFFPNPPNPPNAPGAVMEDDVGVPKTFVAEEDPPAFPNTFDGDEAPPNTLVPESGFEGLLPPRANGEGAEALLPKGDGPDVPNVDTPKEEEDDDDPNTDVGGAGGGATGTGGVAKENPDPKLEGAVLAGSAPGPPLLVVGVGRGDEEPNPENNEGGAGIAGSGAGEDAFGDGEGSPAVVAGVESNSLCKVKRRLLYRSSSSATFTKGSSSTALEIAVKIETFRPRRDV